MKTTTTAVCFALTVILLASCTPKRPYTNDMRRTYQLTNDELSRIQFFLSDDIVLYRGKSSDNTGTSKGEVVVKSDRQIEQVTIKRGTPGVVEKVIGQNRLAVSFEIGEGRFLVFGADQPKGRYYLQAEEWEGKKGKLTYGGSNYFASPGSGSAHLLFKLRKLNQFQKEERVVGGRKVGD